MTGRYQHYPEYKESGQGWCGDIPADWDFRRTKFLFRIEKRIAGELGHPVLSITQKGIKVKDTESGEGQLSMDYSKYQFVKYGDFAMNHMDLLTGYIDISKYDGVTSPDYRVFCSRDSSIIDRYFLYLYQLAYIKGIFFPLGQGSAHLGRWRLPAEEFNGFRWPVPSKKEQEIITNFLDHETAKIDTLIDKQQQLIKLLKEKRQAVISHAVTKGLNPDAPTKDSGVEWLGEVPEHWDVGRIKHLALIISKGTTPTTIGGEFLNEGVQFLKAENVGKQFWVSENPKFYISNEVDEKLSRSRLQAKDVLVIIAGATTGLCSVLPSNIFPANTNQAVSFIRPKNKMHAEFIAHWLGTSFAQSIVWQGAVQAAQPNLSMEDLGNISIPIPPEEEVVKIVSKLEAEQDKHGRLSALAESKIILLQERRTALISAAVTGKIDVRNWQPAQTETLMEASA